MPGYSGPNCTTKCPYPLYGYRCQGYCNCTNYTCDVSTGCRTITSGILQIRKIFCGDIKKNVDLFIYLKNICILIASTFLTVLDTLSKTPNSTSMNKTETILMIQSESKNSTIGKPSPASNKTLHILIILFGGVDIILICIHSAMCVSDQQRQKRSIAMENTRNIPVKNSSYENVEITDVC